MEEHVVVAAGGWRLLASGDAEAAREQFARAAEFAPGRGEFEVGYALAAAASGDMNQGIWAMRRAFRVDPDGVSELAGDERVVTTAERLLRQYAYALENAAENPDAAFMVAALLYLLNETDQAREAIEKAIAQGDRTPSTENLRLLVP